MPDEKKFDVDWFGKIGIFCHEYPKPMVGVHVHNPKTRCRIYKMHEDEFQTVDFWAKLRDKVLMEKYEVLPGDYCPNCHVPLVTWARRWQGRRFCGFCGERFDAKNKR